LVSKISTVTRLREILASYYEIDGSDSERELLLKGTFNGFAEAMLLSGQINHDSIREIVEEEKLRAFEMRRGAQRFAVNGSGRFQSDEAWERFDTPTYLRRPLRCKRKQ
tara:strand:- start:138 stop:464 length:327 start_codon:yes stop_codon:yes gene_type:complete